MSSGFVCGAAFRELHCTASRSPCSAQDRHVRAHAARMPKLRRSVGTTAAPWAWWDMRAFGIDCATPAQWQERGHRLEPRSDQRLASCPLNQVRAAFCRGGTSTPSESFQRTVSFMEPQRRRAWWVPGIGGVAAPPFHSPPCGRQTERLARCLPNPLPDPPRTSGREQNQSKANPTKPIPSSPSQPSNPACLACGSQPLYSDSSKS
jgi:hypothetical protein